MPATIVSEGRTINLTLTGTVAAGDIYEGVGGIGMYLNDGVSGDSVAVLIEGVVTLTKEAPLVITALDNVYWDATNNRIDKTNTNIPAGLAAASAASAAVLVDVKLGVGAAVV